MYNIYNKKRERIVYRLVLDDSYNQRTITVGDSVNALMDEVTKILQDNHLPVNDVNIWDASDQLTVIDYGSWTHFFYIIPT